MLREALAAVAPNEKPAWCDPIPFTLPASTWKGFERPIELGQMHAMCGRGFQFAFHARSILDGIFERMPDTNKSNLEPQRRAIEETIVDFFGERRAVDWFGKIRVLSGRMSFRVLAKLHGYDCENRQSSEPEIIGLPQSPSDLKVQLSFHSPKLLIRASAMRFALTPSAPGCLRIVKIGTTRSPRSGSELAAACEPLSRLDLIQKQTSIGVANPRDAKQGFTGVFPVQFNSVSVVNGVVTHVANPTLVLCRVVPIGAENLSVEQLLWSFNLQGKTTSLIATYSTWDQLLLVPGFRKLLSGWLRNRAVAGRE
jgi:hypothetical protein